MTPLTPRSQKKRDQIVQAAGRLFMQKGFLTTSMDEVAQQAGVSKQTVYAHFGNKNELFVHCIRSKCGGSELLNQSLSGTDPRPVLIDFITGFTQVVFSKEAVYMHRLCVSQADTHPQLSALFFEAGPEQICGMLSAYLQKLSEEGVLELVDARLAAENLLLMAQGMGLLRVKLGLDAQEDEEQRARRLEEVVDFFLRGYGYRQ